MSNQTLSIKQWAEEDRPREKLLRKGKSALSDAELIGILLGSGTRTLSAVALARVILQAVGNDLHELAKLSVGELMKFNGIGEAKAVSIISALELGRRRKDFQAGKRTMISGAHDVYELMKADLMDLKHEEFWIVLLKRNNEVIAKEQISAGGVSATVVDPKIIFKKAIEKLASGIILVHNHPSGNMKPSTEDIQLTQKIKSAGVHLDISILDHLIFADHSYFSFVDEQMM